MKSTTTKGATIEEEVHRLKIIAQENVGKNSFSITHALGNKASFYFGPIVATDNCN